MSILPLVERIAPERVAEVFWRAVALTTPGDDPRTDFGGDNPLAAEALLLSRYDRNVATTLFEPVTAFVRSRSLRDGNDITPVVLLALTGIDPRTAVDVVESLPPARTLDLNDRTNWTRITVAETLAMPPSGAGCASGGSTLVVASRCSRRSIAIFDPAVTFSWSYGTSKGRASRCPMD